MDKTSSIAHILSPDSPLGIVDIGAALLGDQAPEYQLLIDAGVARLVAFEPDPQALQLLRQRYPSPHACLSLIIGDGNPAVFHRTHWSPTSSLLEPNTELAAKFYNLGILMEVAERLHVDTIRLDDVPEIGDVDFVKIDVQGAEKMIFENASDVLAKATVIQTEVSWVELYRGMPLFGDIDRCLRGAGFQWHCRMGCGYRPFAPFINPDHLHGGFRQELWSDVVYVKDWMRFDQLSPEKLVKLAVLLHDLYGSFDLAHLAFQAADCRTGTNFAANYSAWLSGEEDQEATDNPQNPSIS